MKLKKILLCLTLSLCCVGALFGLAGCGEVSLTKINENFDKLQATYQKYSSTVFQSGECGGIQTEYLVKYGEDVDGFINSNEKAYVELRDTYNLMLVVSSDYIDNNKQYIKNLKENELSKSSKNALTKLNSTLVKYTNTIDEFVNARHMFIQHFELHSSQPNDESSLTYLRKFKKAYGELVSRNIDLSMDLAKVVETTKIFDILQSSDPTETDTLIFKEYIRAKMLPVFSEFMITEVANNLNWSAQVSTSTKTRITSLLNKLEEQFCDYRTIFIENSGGNKLDSKEEMKSFFEKIENFLGETEDYLKALKEFDISSLAIDYDNDLDKYKKSNALAEVYLEKMEQFIETSLPAFMTEISSIIY